MSGSVGLSPLKKQKPEAAGSSGAVQALRMENDAPVVGLDAPTANSRMVNRTSASPSCLDGGDVDLLHSHHRLEGTLCLSATSRKRIGQRARGDLPGKAPAVPA